MPKVKTPSGTKKFPYTPKGKEEAADLKKTYAKQLLKKKKKAKK